MSLLAVLTSCVAVLALCTALFQLWLYRLRPREAAHLWIAVLSFGVALGAAGGAAGYEAHTLAAAQRAQLVALSGALPIVVGFFRFSAVFIGVQIRGLEVACGTYAALTTLASWAAPSLLFSGAAIEAVAPTGHRYVQAGLGPAAAALLLGFVPVIGAAISLYARHWHRLRGVPLLTGALVIWGASMASDLCVAFGLYSAPWLASLGFAVFSGALGAILLGRLVRSLAKAERSSAELHRLVEVRTDELRRKDLELAHGARLATLGALAAGIAHEIEQPLAAVSASVKELRGAWRDATRPEAFAHLLATARTGVERIGDVVAKLLQLARREEGRVANHDLPTLVAGVLPIASYALRQRTQLITDLAWAPPVRGDAAMLSQIVLNLLVGALGAFAEGARERGSIRIATGEREGRAILEVTDTAPGLRVESMPKLFGGSEKGDGDDARRIGLAVTHQLVARHGGILELESGKTGNLVRVWLPVAPRTEADA
jgi:signal transduction histidine kinase